MFYFSVNVENKMIGARKSFHLVLLSHIWLVKMATKRISQKNHQPNNIRK